MAFIRYKTVGGKKYAQVVENYRQDGKHRQRVLVHLGGYTPAQALIYWPLFGKRDFEDKAAKLAELVESGKLKVSDEDRREVEEDRRRKARYLSEIERDLF